MEPPVRQQYLALLSVFASLPAMALTFQTRLENIEWKVEGDQFECRLTQPITDFAYNGSLGAGSATLLAAAAPVAAGAGVISTSAPYVPAVATYCSTVPRPRPGVFSTACWKGAARPCGTMGVKVAIRNSPAAGQVQQGLQRLPTVYRQAVCR
ncbi:hypothetical protein Ddc_20886 [Ditylenchus destructor]|nr:hypothetical protein Ddc_20886 [Ditylenchus destructor]